MRRSPLGGKEEKMVADDPMYPPPPRRCNQLSPYSESASAVHGQSAEYWRDLAEQRGQLLRDMTDKWAERRLEFVKVKRAMAEKLFELQVRQRTLTRRIMDLERVLLVIRSLLSQAGAAEERLAMMVPHVENGLQVEVAYPVSGSSRGGYAGAQQE